MPSIVVWGIVFVILTIIELETYQFVSIWFAISALITMLISLTGIEVYWQIIIFVITSILLLLITRPFMKKIIHGKIVHTNADLDIGKNATVIEAINPENNTGRVKLNGVDWAALSSDKTMIPVGATVVVTEIKGSKLIVKQI